MALANVHRFTTDEFLGLEGLPERVELIDGVIYDMTPEGPPHMYAQARVVEALTVAFQGSAWFVASGGSIRVTDDFCPVPDVAVYPRSITVDHATYPDAAVPELVVEIGISSEVTDRTTKLAGYARGGVRRLWLVAPVRGTFVTCADPDVSAGRYRTEVVRSWPDDLDVVVADLAAALRDRA